MPSTQFGGQIGPFFDNVQQRGVPVSVSGTCDFGANGPVADPARVATLAAPWLRGEAVPLVELATGRHNKGYYAFPGPRAAHATAELGERGHPVFAIADLRVELDGDGPTLRAPDGAPGTQPAVATHGVARAGSRRR